MNTLKITKDLLNINELKANKSYGQNFLVNDEILSKIAETADIDNTDLIIEIGPGLGNLTEYLKETNLMLIEIDDKMINILKNRFNEIYILNKDILKINIDEEIEKLENSKNVKFNKVKVVANLPYYITSPILFKIFEESNRISEIIVMVQKEVADRITSKDKSVLSYITEYFGKSETKIIVKPENFIPAPKVNSAVVQINRYDKYKDTNYLEFKELVHKSFASRRKKLINSLVISGYKGLDKTKIEEVLIKLNIDIMVRAENLTIDDYINMVKEFSKY